MPQQEIWKTWNDYPDYVFSNTGKCYSYKSNRYIGSQNKRDGYIRVGLKDNINPKPNQLLLSRIIYYLFGDKPELLPYREVDHENHEEPWNNNINNLRLATRKENLANKGKQKINKHGNQCSSCYIGVSWAKYRWHSYIDVGKRFGLGNFKYERNAAYVFNCVASTFKPPHHWFNQLGNDFELPDEDENREYIISQTINKINHYLGD
jgi:hypothetical protein